MKLLKEIENFPTLSEEEENEIIKKIKLNDDQEAKNKLILSHLKNIKKIAKLFQYRGVSMEELIEEGVVGLITALKFYKPNIGVRFISYASWWITNFMHKLIYEQTRIVKVPIQKITRRKLIKIENELAQKFGKMPSVEEIAEALGIKIQQVNKAIKAIQQDISLDTEISERVSLTDFISSKEETENSIIKNLLKEEIEKKLDTLKEREKIIIKLRFGLNGEKPHTLREIGEKLNLSRERIRQIEKKVLEKIRKRLK